MKMHSNSPILSGLMGVCVGDALGFPVQFISRAERVSEPVRGMSRYSLWSDDSSLTFCLAEAMCEGFSLEAIAANFVRWFETGYWTPHGHAFDIGQTTLGAINRLKEGVAPVEAGGCCEGNNGNGSLMRILPISFYHNSINFADLIERSHQVSCLTHAHPRSQMACGIYTSIASFLLEESDILSAYWQGIERVRDIYSQPPYVSEMPHFQRIVGGEIDTLTVDEIKSNTYVVHTLEAALWCLVTTDSYAEAVLKAVNLGDDTDTVAAVTGGLAGIYYGCDRIPQDWRDRIHRYEDIIDLANRLEFALG